MATINCELLFKPKLNYIWAKALPLSTGPSLINDIISRGYAIEREVTTDSLLFVSMNPSFKDGAWNNGNRGGSIFYDIPLPKAPKATTNSFFIAINEFYAQIKCPKKPPLAHHDLLFLRETKQNTVLEMKKDPILKDFFEGQLDISKEIIEKSTPALIVVLNAGARELFKELFGNGKFDTKLGAYIYCINGKETPVLFSGMLSGQRALDLGSKESLKWHIEFILKQIL